MMNLKLAILLSLTLEWDHSPDAMFCEEYRLYETSGTRRLFASVPATEDRVTINIGEGRYAFVVVAYDAETSESPDSNTLLLLGSNPASPINLRLMDNPTRSVAVRMSNDLVSWTPVVVIEVGGVRRVFFRIELIN